MRQSRRAGSSPALRRAELLARFHPGSRRSPPMALVGTPSASAARPDSLATRDGASRHGEDAMTHDPGRRLARPAPAGRPVRAGERLGRRLGAGAGGARGAGDRHHLGRLRLHPRPARRRADHAATRRWRTPRRWSRPRRCRSAATSRTAMPRRPRASPRPSASPPRPASPAPRSRTPTCPAPAPTPFELAVERVRAAAAAARALPRDFVLVARADGLLTGGYDLDEALRRLRGLRRGRRRLRLRAAPARPRGGAGGLRRRARCR